MDNLDDIKSALIDPETNEVIALFSNPEHAEKLKDALGYDEYIVADRDDGDFYVDIHVETSSSFDVRV